MMRVLKHGGGSVKVYGAHPLNHDSFYFLEFNEKTMRQSGRKMILVLTFKKQKKRLFLSEWTHFLLLDVDICGKFGKNTKKQNPTSA